MRLGLALGGVLLAAPGLVSCGGDDGDGPAGGKDEVSVEEFCAAAEKFENTFTETDTTNLSEGVGALKDAARELKDVGTPDDIPDDAREGLELTLDKLIALPDDADQTDLHGDARLQRGREGQVDGVRGLPRRHLPLPRRHRRLTRPAAPSGPVVRGWGADGTDVGRRHEARTARSKPRPGRGRGGRLRRRRRQWQCHGGRGRLHGGLLRGLPGLLRRPPGRDRPGGEPRRDPEEGGQADRGRRHARRHPGRRQGGPPADSRRHRGPG